MSEPHFHTIIPKRMPLDELISKPAPYDPALDISDERIQRIFESALRRVFCPEQQGLIDPRHFARVTFTMDDGSEMRGVVYAVEKTE